MVITNKTRVGNLLMLCFHHAINPPMHHTLTEYKRHLDDLEKIRVTPELTNIKGNLVFYVELP